MIGTPDPTASSSAASSGGGGACAQAFQQRVSQRKGTSQARTARSAAGQERGFSGRPFFPRSGTAAGSRGLRSPAGRARCGQPSFARGLPPAEAEGGADQRPVPADGGVAADLEVRPPEFALDALVAVLGPVAPRVELGDLLERGALEVRGQIPRRLRRQAAPVGGDAEGANLTAILLRRRFSRRMRW